jgi:hypothetical protein
MTGPELLRRRTELGISLEELAESIQEHVDQVRGYERSPGKLPTQLGIQLEYAMAWMDRTNRLNAAGLTSCPEMEQIFAGMKPGRKGEVERRIKLADQHTLTCERCQAREAMMKTFPPLPRVPMPASARFFLALNAQIQRLPAMLRPAVWGAVMIGGMTLVRAGFYFLFHPARPLQAIGAVCAAIGVGAYGGAVGGVAYGVTRPRTLRFGRLGDYLTGIACAFAYLFAFAIPINLFTDDDMFRGTTSWLIFVVLALVFGAILGHSMFKSEGRKSEMA